MNIKLNILTAAILAGFAASASSAPTYLFKDIGPVGKDFSVPIKSRPLSKPERGAFLLIEAAQQIAEGRIYLYGCKASKGTVAVSVVTDERGAGDLEMVSPGSTFTAVVSPGVSDPLLGDKWSVRGTGALTGKAFTGYSAQAAFDKAGGLLTQASVYNGKSINGVSDPMSGLVIKDFYWGKHSNYNEGRCVTENNCDGVPTLYDWGLQAVDKKGYPQDKYWQWSRAWRSDGIEGHTDFHKTRIYHAYDSASACSIDVDLDGVNTADGFDQQGTLTVRLYRDNPK